MVGGQRSIGVCVDRLKPGLEGTKELAKPLKQAQDLVQRSTMNMASRKGFLEQTLKLEGLVQRHAESPTAKTKVPAYPHYAPAKLQLGV